MRAHVDQERWILLPAAAELEWRDYAWDKIQHENERSRKNEDCPESGDENLFRLDGQTCERQVIALAREKRLPLNQCDQAGNGEYQRQQCQFIGKRSGAVVFDGKNISRASSDQIARMGVAFCPEERGIFASLDVR